MTTNGRPHATPPHGATCQARHRNVRAFALVALLALPMGVPVAAASAQRLAVGRPAIVVRLASNSTGDLEGVPLALRQPVTLDLRHVTVERVLRDVMAQTGVSLAYSRAVVPLEKIVSVRMRDGSAIDALRKALGDTDVELWVSRDGRLALVPAMPADTEAAAQTGTVSGRVTDVSSGMPLADVTVRVGTTRLGAVTNSEGRFTIATVPIGPQWVYAQRIGFARDSQSVNVADNQVTTVEFALRVVAVQLQQQVVIGYGATARRNLTAAVSTVDAEEIEAQPVRSVDEALLGRAPGVQVVTQSGQPGAGAMVRIRGGNSISASNAPLYVIDGVPVVASASGANTGTLQTTGAGGLNPLASISPSDIESIDVLKDAAAAAIYGSRAANGVILITTKRGRAGQNSIRFGSYYGTQEVRRTLPLLNAQQFATFVNQANVNAGQPAKFTQAEIDALGAGTDWQDAIFRTAPVRNYELSFTGGDKDTRYFMSGSLLQQQGVVIGTNMDRGSVRLNLDQDISTRFRLGTRLTFSREKGQLLPHGGAGQEQSSVLLNALFAPPTLSPRTSGGEFFDGDNPFNGRPFANPVATALLITNREEQNRGIGNVFGEYDLFGRLTFRTSFGADFLASTQNYYSPSNTLPGRNYSGYGSRGTQQTTNWQSENTLHWAGDVAANQNLDLVGGLTLQRTNSENISGTAQNFLTDRLGENGLNTGGTFVGVWTGAPHSSLLSYFSRANYNLLDRYLVTLSGRVDGSSKFGTGNQYGFFPSASFAWRISEEPFLSGNTMFDDLKLRVGYGRTGNQDIGNYASLATLRSVVYTIGGQRAIGYVPNSIANEDLKWETTDGTNVGLDVTVLDERLSVTADVYDKKTRDLLLYVPIPRSSGFSSSLQNIGSVRNRGLELGINTVNVAGRLGWTSSLNLAWNRNKVLDLGPDEQILAPAGVGAGANQNPTILRVGVPINSFYGYVFAGLDADGQPTYADLDGDGDVTEADQRIIGGAQPDYTGGFTNRFTFGNFGLDVFLQFSMGNDIYNINRALLTSGYGNANQLVDVLTPGGTIPTPRIGNTFETRPSTLFVEDGSYIRGKNLRVSYNVPPQFIARWGGRSLGSLQLYASVQNFFTITDYTGYDPEISEYALSNLAQGIDFGTYPQARQITFGFNAGF
jgi:TonB-linked SusC/RagA family outer membrane protein